MGGFYIRIGCDLEAVGGKDNTEVVGGVYEVGDGYTIAADAGRTNNYSIVMRNTKKLSVAPVMENDTDIGVDINAGNIHFGGFDSDDVAAVVV